MCVHGNWSTDWMLEYVDEPFTLDVVIPNFIPMNESNRRIVLQQPHPMLRLHVFTIYEKNDSMCYLHPNKSKAECTSRSHMSPEALALLGARSKVSYQVC